MRIEPEESCAKMICADDEVVYRSQMTKNFCQKSSPKDF